MRAGSVDARQHGLDRSRHARAADIVHAEIVQVGQGEGQVRRDVGLHRVTREEPRYTPLRQVALHQFTECVHHERLESVGGVGQGGREVGVPVFGHRRASRSHSRYRSSSSVWLR